MKVIIVSAVWCPSCLVMNKIWKKISADYPNVEIIKYDYDLDEDIVLKYNIGETLPVYIFLDNEEEVGRIEGETTYEEIVKYFSN